MQVTHLFRDVLHGWGQIMLSVNVSPCAKDYDETSHVLKVLDHSSSALTHVIGQRNTKHAPHFWVSTIHLQLNAHCQTEPGLIFVAKEDDEKASDAWGS